TELADQVNAVHTGALTADGTPGRDVFAFAAGLPPARGLTVAATRPGDLAAPAPRAGNLDGSTADEIAALALSDTGPDAVWAAFVTRTAVASSGAAHDATLAAVGRDAAQAQLLSVASVSLDEESVNLLAYQHAYQGSARVLTAVDELLDTLINRTGAPPQRAGPLGRRRPPPLRLPHPLQAVPLARSPPRTLAAPAARLEQGPPGRGLPRASGDPPGAAERPSEARVSLRPVVPCS